MARVRYLMVNVWKETLLYQQMTMYSKDLNSKQFMLKQVPENKNYPLVISLTHFQKSTQLCLSQASILIMHVL